jgi:hypothetical protein
MIRTQLNGGLPVALFSAIPALSAALAAALLLATPPLHASSPQAWEAQRRQLIEACRQVSGLRQTRPVGDPVDFPELVALLQAGAYPQPHMAGRRGRELCLFDKRSGRARVAEADRLLLPAAVAPRPTP